MAVRLSDSRTENIKGITLSELFGCHEVIANTGVFANFGL